MLIRAVALVSAALLLSTCGPKSMSARRSASQKIADAADEELSKAERAMGELDPKAAQDAIASAKKLLADPDAQLYPEYDMLVGRAKEDEAKLPDVKRARELKDLQENIAKRKAKIEEAHVELKKALKALDAANVEKGNVDDAAKAAGNLLDELRDGTDFETKDKAYSEYAKLKREVYAAAKEPIATARARVEFMEGPAALREKAAEAFKEGKGQKASADKKSAFAEAKKLYDKCQDACRKLLTASPAISRLPIMASGRKTTPEALDTACSAEWQDVDKAEKKIKPDKVPPPPKKKR